MLLVFWLPILIRELVLREFVATPDRGQSSVSPLGFS